MSHCADYASQIQLYLDDELKGSDAESFLAHLDRCEPCRRETEASKAFSRRLRQARPFAVAPASLHERIAALAATRDTSKPEVVIHETKLMAVRTRKKTVQYGLAAAAMLFLVAGGLFVGSRLRSESNANSFVATAIDSHQALSDATLQLDVQSELPSVVAAWFSQRVSFPFRMPNTGIAANNLAKYKLSGGRLVTFRVGASGCARFSIVAGFSHCTGGPGQSSPGGWREHHILGRDQIPCHGSGSDACCDVGKQKSYLCLNLES